MLSSLDSFLVSFASLQLLSNIEQAPADSASAAEGRAFIEGLQPLFARLANVFRIFVFSQPFMLMS
jgi:hypothetical protein